MTIKISVFAIKEQIEKMEVCSVCGELIMSKKVTPCIEFNGRITETEHRLCESCEGALTDNGVEIYG